MTLTIRKKLIILGIISVFSLALSSYFSYQNSVMVKNLNAMSSVTQANGIIVQRMVTHRQELVEAFLSTMLHKDEGTVVKEDLEKVKAVAEKLNTMTSRLIGREISYLKKDDTGKAAELAKEMEKIATEDAPKLIELKASDEEFTKLFNSFNQKAVALTETQAVLRDTILEEVNRIGDEVITDLDDARRQVLIILGIALAILIPLLTTIIISIVRPLKKVCGDIENLAEGETNIVLDENPKDDEIGQIIKSMKKLRVSVDKSVSLQSAVDNVKGFVMMTDNNNMITYVNKTMLSMLSSREGEISAAIAGLSAKTIIGKNINFLGHDGSNNSTVKIANYLFDTTSSPVINAKGEKIGTVIEWIDVTEKRKQEQLERAIQQEIETVVDATTKGDFSQRLPIMGREGFMLKLCEGMNRISTISEKGLNEIKEVMVNLAEGDLTKKIDGEYQGMFDDIKQAINETIETLKKISGEIKASAGSVFSSANEIASSSSDLSKRTEAQASTLEETAASMEEITSTVKSNSKNAQDANLFAQDAKLVAEEGGAVVNKVVDAMKKISSSSNEISDIISVIDEIAFQTNLLALNAAVEAARAGDAGKGFAVVAQEVRSLAGRSAEASKQIKGLINQSVVQVNDGSALVEKAGATLGKVVDSFNKLANFISEITVASEEQSRGINEVNSAVTQIDSATQENAAMVEEASASAQTLTELATNLNELVSFFRAGEEGEDFTPKKSQQSTTPKLIKNNASIKLSSVKKMENVPASSETGGGWEEF
jgi:methyl-accepting chemotaxis protein